MVLFEVDFGVATGAIAILNHNSNTVEEYSCHEVTCFHPSDPSIKPKPTAEVDPTVFEKRFLKKVRDLGEVRCPSVFLLCIWCNVYLYFYLWCINALFCKLLYFAIA